MFDDITMLVAPFDRDIWVVTLRRDSFLELGMPWGCWAFGVNFGYN